MKIVTMFGDMIRAAVRRPVTQPYPFKRLAAPEHLRGQLHFTPTGCTGCQLCVKDCPANAIELITIDKAAKRFAMRYHMDRCTYCAQCVQNCRFSCIQMASDQWELASATRDAFTVVYGEPSDVQSLLARAAAPAAG